VIRGQSGQLPDPDAIHPVANKPRVVFLKPLLASQTGHEYAEVGDFTYYDDPLHARDFFRRNVTYNFGGSGARLIIGKFCAIATAAQFMMPEANHAMAGPSTYPFGVLGGAFAHALPLERYPWRTARDTVVGHDVWVGAEALILPGVTIGHGAVIGTRAVVSRDVPDYAVVAGNPARIVRRRYDAANTARLLALAWWDWPVARIAAAIPILVQDDVAALEAFAARD